MTATTTAADRSPELSGDKAERIVRAMRASVARRGATGSTFDHVAREAGVSRGLLHYYFGTKERLLVAVVRHDCDIRMAMLDRALADAHSADDIVNALVRSLEDVVEREPDFFALLLELVTLARRNEEIAGELAELGRRMRAQVAALLAAKRDEGVLALGGEPEEVAGVLLALGDGLALRMLAEPGVDRPALLRAGVACARALLV